MIGLTCTPLLDWTVLPGTRHCSLFGGVLQPDDVKIDARLVARRQLNSRTIEVAHELEFKLYWAVVGEARIRAVAQGSLIYSTLLLDPRIVPCIHDPTGP